MAEFDELAHLAPEVDTEEALGAFRRGRARRRRGRRLGVVGLGGLAAVGLVVGLGALPEVGVEVRSVASGGPATTTSTEVPAPGVTVTPSSAVRGEVVRVRLMGVPHLRGKLVELSMASPDPAGEVLGFGSAWVSGDGNATLEFTVPAVLGHETVVEPGAYPLSVTTRNPPTESFGAELEVVAAVNGPSYPHRFVLRCGFERTFFDGRMWLVVEEPDINVISKEDDNAVPGTIVLHEDGSATFRSGDLVVRLREATPEELAGYDGQTHTCG